MSEEEWAHKFMGKRPPVKVPPQRTMHTSFIGHHIANHLGVTLEMLRQPSRVKTLVYGRDITCYLARKYTRDSYAQIAKVLGWTNHTTGMHAFRKVDEDLQLSSEAERFFIDIRLSHEAYLEELRGNK